MSEVCNEESRSAGLTTKTVSEARSLPEKPTIAHVVNTTWRKSRVLFAMQEFPPSGRLQPTKRYPQWAEPPWRMGSRRLSPGMGLYVQRWMHGSSGQTERRGGGPFLRVMTTSQGPLTVTPLRRPADRRPPDSTWPTRSSTRRASPAPSARKGRSRRPTVGAASLGRQRSGVADAPGHPRLELAFRS
jgi:hypothetical protein